MQMLKDIVQVLICLYMIIRHKILKLFIKLTPFLSVSVSSLT